MKRKVQINGKFVISNLMTFKTFPEIDKIVDQIYSNNLYTKLKNLKVASRIESSIILILSWSQFE